MDEGMARDPETRDKWLTMLLVTGSGVHPRATAQEQATFGSDPGLDPDEDEAVIMTGDDMEKGLVGASMAAIVAAVDGEDDIRVESGDSRCIYGHGLGLVNPHYLVRMCPICEPLNLVDGGPRGSHGGCWRLGGERRPPWAPM